MPISRASGGAAAAADSVTGGAGAAAVITYAAAGAGVAHGIDGVAGSYSAAPTGGGLKIEDGGGTIVFQVDITAAGPFQFLFPSTKRGSPNTAMIITLAAPGGAVVARINSLGHWTE